LQTPKGVKASVDGLLLARFIKPSPEWRVADLGCGNGLVSLLLAKINGLDNIHFLQADLRNYPWKDALERFDMVVANPPYRKVGTGRISPDPIRAAARHEILGDVSDFARSASALLRDGGASTWIYLAERYEDLVTAVTDAGLTPVRRRLVISREGEQPSLILLEALKGEGLGKVYEEEPLVLYEKGGGRNYTEEAREIIYGKADEELESRIQNPEEDQKL
jgi:tRNA1Val (adenine37-N6)-methyltransferase